MFDYQTRTLKGTQFTGAIAQNARQNENILLSPALQGTAGSARNILRALTVFSDENLAWEVQFYSSTAFSNGDLDADTFVGKIVFAVADGAQVAGAGSFYYFSQNQQIPLWDDNATGKLHVSLVNRSAASKTAGSNGEIVLIFHLEPMQYGAGA